MREIKFRAWDTRFKIMFDVSEINFGKNSYIKGISDQFCRDFILMQYTGEKDKTGKEIYEGDICLHTSPVDGENKIFEVEFLEEFGQYAEWNKQGLFCEIIGNIYENPELLGK